MAARKSIIFINTSTIILIKDPNLIFENFSYVTFMLSVDVYKNYDDTFLLCYHNSYVPNPFYASYSPKCHNHKIYPEYLAR